jgi:hypothetical protein
MCGSSYRGLAPHLQRAHAGRTPSGALYARNLAKVMTANVGIEMKRILIALMLICVGGCQKLEISTGKPCAVVESRIRDYFVAKYPSFGEMVALRKEPNPVVASNKADALYKVCPVTEGMNSYAHGPYLGFVEKTEVSQSTIHVVSIGLYSEKDGTCRVVARIEERKKQPSDVATRGKPITEAELQEILK